MPSILPTTPIAATRVDPKIFLIYGLPKVGKTTKVAELPNNLILDLENGTELIDALKVNIRSIEGQTKLRDNGTVISTTINAVYDDIIQQAKDRIAETGKAGKPPYKYITVDTLDKLEDFCIPTATFKYKQTSIGKNFEGDSVLDLAGGGGYYHLRNELIFQIERLATICEYLILVSHVREKTLNKAGIEVSVRDLPLSGKLGGMVAAKCDAIGYVYQMTGKPLMINFQTAENNIMGSRVQRLAGKNMPFRWEDIFSAEYPGQQTIAE